MSSDRAYRIIVAFDTEKNDFVARVPELDLEARAATRAEAVTGAEDALEQKLAGAAEDKKTLPEPVDAQAPGGALTLELASPLFRDLAFHARLSKLAPEAFAAQLLARAIGALDGARPRRRGPEPQEVREDGDRETGPERDRDRDDRRGGGRGRRREGYRPELDDKANFLEYLRGLEKGGGQGGGGRGRRG